MRRFLQALVVILVLACPLDAQERPFGMLREQAVVQQGRLALRLERVLPRLMRELTPLVDERDPRTVQEDRQEFAITGK